MKQIPGAIGYVELAYAKQNNMAWAQLQNKAKKYVEPELKTRLPPRPTSQTCLTTWNT